MLPPPSLLEVQVNFIGAWRLFRRDPGGAALFGRDEQAFWKSFWCAAIIAPAYIALLLLIPDQLRSEAPLARVVPVEVISYTIGWVAWPLVVHAAFGVLGIRDKFIPYIVAYNWSSGPQIVLLLLITLVCVTFNLPLSIFLMFNLIAMVWLLAYHGYIIKVTTGLDLPVVVFMVLGEAVLSYMINFARDVVTIGVL
ncbi:hypothetical protein [Hwanghaeella sp.]|uniref:hypothetical protein n=1 Tax=Hwanghaeella sp. TaxID=2605943 RepID=UPI003CCC0379